MGTAYSSENFQTRRGTKIFTEFCENM